LVSEDVVVSSVGDIASAIETASGLFSGSKALKERFRTVLGIPKNVTPVPEDQD